MAAVLSAAVPEADAAAAFSTGVVTARAVTTPLEVLARDGAGGGSVTTAWPAGLFPLQGHYPGFPIVPGVFLVETADRAVQALDGDRRWTGIRSTRFLRPVFPGDVLRADVTLSLKGGVTTAKCALSVAGEAAASVTLTYDPDAPAPAAPAEAEGSAGEGVEADRDVAQILPHRYPMLLVDRVRSLVPARALVAEKAVSAGEWPFAGGPTTAGYPWPLTVESWCQSAGVLAAWDLPNPDVLAGQVMLFGGISGAAFGTPARPGDVLVHRVRLDRDLGDVLMMSGSCEVAGRTVMTLDRITMAMRPAGELARAAKEA